MLKNIKKFNFILSQNNNEYDSYKEDIVKYWNDFSKDKTEIFNGDVVSVQDINETNDDYKLTLNIIKFSDVVYSKMVGKIKTRALFSGGYILTSDNYIGFVIDRRNTLNLVGGMASTEDFINNKYNPNLCMFREFKEELGIDIECDKFNSVIKYIKYPAGSENTQSHYPTGLIYEIKTNYTKEELSSLFNTSKHDNEINSILFLNYDDCDKLSQYTKKDYIDELYRLIIKEVDPNERK